MTLLSSGDPLDSGFRDIRGGMEVKTGGLPVEYAAGGQASHSSQVSSVHMTHR